MPETKYGRDTQRLEIHGIDLNRPVDSVKPNKLPYAKNIRSYQAGRIEPRMGMVDLGEVVAGQAPVHSVRRLNDLTLNDFRLVIGTGSHLALGRGTYPYSGVLSYTDLGGGWSGDPLALVPWKPIVTAFPYMYVADRLKMRKVNVAETLDTLGYPRPTFAPNPALSPTPSYKVIDEFDSILPWSNGGTSVIFGAPVIRTSGSIAVIVYDDTATNVGWASVILDAMDGVGYGERLVYNFGSGNSEVATVQAVYPGSVAAPNAGYTSTTIAGVIYDTGSSGPCSLVLTEAIAQVSVDAFIHDMTNGEYTRILGVIAGPDGTTSLRLAPSLTWVAGDSVQVVTSYRTYLVATHVGGESVTSDSLRMAVSAGTGYITRTAPLDPITNAVPLNLSVITAGVTSQPDDYMHISLRISDPSLLTELKVMLDVDANPLNQDFQHNFYERVIRPSDLTPSIADTQSLLATQPTIISNAILDSPISISSNNSVTDLQPNAVTTPATSPIVYSQQLEPGTNQWVDVVFRLSDLIRVGTDDTRSLGNVVALRILATTTGTVNIDVDSWWIGGGYGPDTGDATAINYLYRYRIRNPATNVASNFSPPTQYESKPLRQSVVVSLTQVAAPANTTLTTDDFVLDIARFGGQLTDWRYVGTVPNSLTPTFTDKYGDDIVGGNPILLNDNYEPWPIKGTPVAGTTSAVAGTLVDGDGVVVFDASWAAGTRILINHVPYTIRRVMSFTRLELNENAGVQGAVEWRIDEPTILAQPLPCLWQWDDRFFACGDDVYNAGRLYYSNPSSETTQINNYIDITSPSEPLMNGLSYNVRAFVFSSENFIQLLRTGDPAAPYRFEIIPNGEGLFARWWLTREPAPLICFGSKDGIYQSSGGTPFSLTDADLYDLFPNEGNLGDDVNGVFAPSIIAGDSTLLRLTLYDEFLYFDYPIQQIIPTPPVVVNVDVNVSGLELVVELGTVTVEIPVVPCPGFNDAIRVTVDRTQIPTTIANYVIGLEITDDRLRTVANGGSVESDDGFDIRPSQADCTELVYELEDGGYDPVTGTLLMWVLLPTANGSEMSGNTQFQLNFGNALLTTDNSSEATWAVYNSVTHLNVIATGLYCTRDSTYFLTAPGTPWRNIFDVTAATAQIGNGGVFTNGPHLRLDGGPPTRYVVGTQDATVSFWMKTTTPATTGSVLGAVNFLICSGFDIAYFFVETRSSGVLRAAFKNADGTQLQNVDTNAVVCDDTWHHIVITRVGATVNIYIDGVLDTTNIAAYTVDVTDTGGGPELGTIDHSTCSPPYTGSLDEVRSITDTAWDADRVTAEYNNQKNIKNPSTFFTLT